MSAYRKLQSKFAKAVGKLIDYAYAQGWELTVGDAYRDPRVFGAVGVKKGYSHPNSTHKHRLAIDLALFVNDKWQQTETAEYKDMHRYWETLGGAPAVPGDANHFSFEYQGVR